MPSLATNKKATFDYEILDTYEAGIVLSGQEVKSVRAGHMSLKSSYVSIHHDELYLKNATIPAYRFASIKETYNPEHTRKLLLHKKEIDSLIGKLQQQGLTLIPLSVYTKRTKIKIELGLARGKKKGDKRETIKKREVDRDIQRTLKYKQ